MCNAGWEFEVWGVAIYLVGPVISCWEHILHLSKFFNSPVCLSLENHGSYSLWSWHLKDGLKLTVSI